MLAERTVERAVRFSWLPIDPHVLRQAIGKEHAARHIHEKVEVKIIVKELELKVVAKVRHTSRETAYLGTTPARGPG